MQAILVTPFGEFGRSVFSLIFDSGPFAKFILLILFVLSVISWAIIYDRSRLFLRLRRGGRTLQAGLAQKGLALPMETVKKCMPSVEGALLIEAKRYLEDSRKESVSGEYLKGILDARATSEISEMEKSLIFLATTASVSPFSQPST